ncbi:hypothetical protein [Aureimonas sp. D3]|uniref:hypothetical protein n=1 Tax=Aureimonas sp. D3 TaxID=1638164 RepID=UPI000783B485|nr:hypothetical protein [Aureimonas sp. D3]
MFQVAVLALGPTKRHANNQLAIKADNFAELSAKKIVSEDAGKTSGQIKLIAVSTIKTEI